MQRALAHAPPNADKLPFIATVAAAAFVVFCFHDRSWWPPDEGVYGYVAQRLLRGDILHRDVQDIHFGLVHFLHALAFAVFGEDLLSLRYPLAFVTVVQAVIVWRLLADRGPWLACAGALGVTALSFVQFLNPSANWYALFLGLATAAALVSFHGSKRDYIVGALVMLAILVRQLSGVFVAMGALTFLLAESHAAAGRPRVARAAVVVMGLGLGSYLVSRASIGSLLVYGPWPIALLAIVFFRTALDDRAALRLLARLAAGGLAALAPLIAYHLAHGSVGDWLEDGVVAAFHLASFDFFREQRYFAFLVFGLASLIREFSFGAAVNLVFWLVLLSLPVALGLMTIRAARRTPAVWHPLPIMGVFFSLVLVHYEIPVYLMFSAGAVLAGALWLAGASTTHLRPATAIAAGLAAIALFHHAGQPLSRGALGIVRGDRVAPAATEGLVRARLAIEPSDRETYTRLIAIVAQHARPCDTVLALPLNPEINFLADRRAPFRFASAAIGLTGTEAVERAALQIAAEPAAVLVHRRHDKYNTPLVVAFLERIKPLYRHHESVGGFDVLVPRSDARPAPRDCARRGG